MKFENLLTEALLDSLRKREDHIFKPGPDTFWCPSVVYTEDMGRELEAIFEWLIQKITWKPGWWKAQFVLLEDSEADLPIEIDGKWEGDYDDFVNAFQLVLKKLGWDEKVLRRVVCFVGTLEKREPSSKDDFNHAVLGVSIFFKKRNILLVFDSRMKRVKTLLELIQDWGFSNFTICSVFHNGEYRHINFS